GETGVLTWTSSSGAFFSSLSRNVRRSLTMCIVFLSYSLYLSDRHRSDIHPDGEIEERCSLLDLSSGCVVLCLLNDSIMVEIVVLIDQVVIDQRAEVDLIGEPARNVWTEQELHRPLPRGWGMPAVECLMGARFQELDRGLEVCSGEVGISLPLRIDRCHNCQRGLGVGSAEQRGLSECPALTHNQISIVGQEVVGDNHYL